MTSETWLSPTALSLAYLLQDSRVTALTILGISRVERLAEAAQVLTLTKETVRALLS